MTSKTPHIMLIMVTLIKYEVIMNHATRRDNGRGCFFFIYIADAVDRDPPYLPCHSWRFKN